MAPPKMKRKTMFLKREKLAMVTELEGDDLVAICKRCSETIRADIHLERYDLRRTFVERICQDTESFSGLIKVLVNKYLSLFKEHMKGNRFAQFEQSWFTHLESYFTPDTCYHGQWNAMAEKCSEPGCTTLGLEEQHIVLASIAYSIYDIMTEKVKQYKLDSNDTSTSATCISLEQVTTFVPPVKDKKFAESNVSLYRYDGFALHSLVQRLKPSSAKSVTSQCSRSQDRNREMLAILKKMK